MEQRLPNWLKQRAYLTPNRKAVIFQGKSLTFEELYNEAVLTAKKISSLSIREEDTAAILLSNHMDTFITIHALQQLNVRTVFLNLRLTPPELAWQLKDAGVNLLITETQFMSKKDEIHSILPNLHVKTLEEISSSNPDEVSIRDEFSTQDVCSIMYTSGTTGNPKGVLQSYGNHWWSAIGSSLNLGIRDNDVWGCAVPLFHISGLSILMRGVIYGMTVMLYPQFEPNEMNTHLKQGRLTIISVVSAMLQRMLNDLNEERYHPSFRCMLLGGGPAPLPILQACMDQNIPVFQTYGMTETSSQIVTLAPEDSLRKVGSAGKPLFPCQLKIENSDGGQALPMEAGEIIVKGPNVTSGYLKREDANRTSFTDGWFKTGDIGYLDEEGFLFVLDRRSDLIISGGENIYPAEIESVLLSHPSIADAGVKGMHDPDWGEVPFAFVVIKEAVTEMDIIRFCMDRLAKYKVPKKVHFVSELPRNASNKLLRRELPLLIE
ncbi:o-succinylbenzoate--CoA ligase [Falsibacillus albus]|uniref:2-succinylbenzoate--CoA ligase n=1 Tax=Falsibacillus albus TaxID=2478915 RepID=A0A3L7KAY9_9BACI|nr:o-succinylbenzoate--CoA ligase [Falsibacillus albus]RLQ97842.1 o-succinylbenzoate--CoA ligase [Falsibacillus albus]